MHVDRFLERGIRSAHRPGVGALQGMSLLAFFMLFPVMLGRAEPAKSESAKPEPAKSESAKPEPAKADAAKPESKATDYKQYLKLELDRLDKFSKMAGLMPEAKQYIEDRKKEIEQRMAAASEGTPGQVVEFLNTRAFGSKFIYVIDKSRSMLGKRMKSAKAELMKSLGQCSEGTRFYVIFYDTKAHEMPGGGLMPATQANKEMCRAWADRIQPEGMTDPSSALIRAFKLGPDAVFLLSDGLFDETIPSLIKVVNKPSQFATVNTIAFMSDEGAVLLERIARENAGQYVYIEPPSKKGGRGKLSWWPFRFSVEDQ